MQHRVGLSGWKKRKDRPPDPPPPVPEYKPAREGKKRRQEQVPEDPLEELKRNAVTFPICVVPKNQSLSFDFECFVGHNNHVKHV